MSDHVIALVGNPNCGKTSLFNALTGVRQIVGNWPGVTVEKCSSMYEYNNAVIEVIDLPGTYCLDVSDSEVPADERIARDYILSGQADLVINILDASNFERNLYLTTQLLDMGVPVVVVLNMMDVAETNGLVIDIRRLSEQFACPVMTVIASKNKGVKELKQQLDVFLRRGVTPARHIPLDEGIEQCLKELKYWVEKEGVTGVAVRWYSLKLLEGEAKDQHLFSKPAWAEGRHLRIALEQRFQSDIDILIASGRYTAIADLMTQVIRCKGEASHKLSERIDRVVLNKVLGLPVFFFMMYLMFMFSINFGGAFIDFFDGLTKTVLVDGAGYLFSNMGMPVWMVKVLADGVGGGIQTVSTFIPVIACLFLFLSLIEASGYMARAAFVMDRFMRLLGLPGKAFVPMIVGFGCNVPAIMATRTLDNEKDRLLTISMAPFMSCGARLPVYVLFATTFFPASGQNVVFILYLVGIAAAVFTGMVVKSSLLNGVNSTFIMELPNYHMPSTKQILQRTWDRLKVFVIHAGKAIVLVVVILKILSSIGVDGSFGYENTEKSILSKIGKMVTPVFSPIGITTDNWPAVVGIFTGILAKETVVGTLDSMYQVMAVAENGYGGDVYDFNFWRGIQDAFATIPKNLETLVNAMADPIGIGVGDLSDLDGMAEKQGVAMDTFTVMRNVFPSNAAVIAYLLFILLYTPCIAALGAIYRETNLRWTLFVACWTFLLGYAVATIYYQLSLFSIQPLVSLSWLALIATLLIMVFVLMKFIGSGGVTFSGMWFRVFTGRSGG
ncbi:MAG: Fe(2+) transporter permease subunit FeoB [Candidatus Endonucleobacter bathymodioli]|uniref:Ferrous iron transport protein B n=1 Tax=Candidatus Endonucleibacter bathymodioli TaxID=539814 RepID=A0AA90SMI4_9GAMM|nr:Fe(2+) transporter permease subunit FeoB [Candidatus Endonucleobacter bathymodioli]